MLIYYILFFFFFAYIYRYFFYLNALESIRLIVFSIHIFTINNLFMGTIKYFLTFIKSFAQNIYYANYICNI